MRDIKFRSWNRNSSDMAYGVIISGDTQTEVGDEVLMQYTGLEDMNDAEIWEGDVVIDKSRQGGGRTFTVHTYNGMTIVKGIDSPDSFAIGGYDWDNLRSYVEVVGNVYENPGLVKKDGDIITEECGV